MIDIVCDNCEETFQVAPDQAGTKVPCPMCGDVNRVPAVERKREVTRETKMEREPEETGETRSASDGLPVAGGPERDIMVVHPAMGRAHPFRFLFLALLVVAGVVGMIAGGMRDQRWLLYLSIAPFVVGLGWLAKWWIASSLWIKITITNKRTVRHEGIVRRHSTEVLHDHVRSVDINQNFVQRMFNTGYIGIDSAGQDGIEIEIRDIPGPYEIKKVIDRYRKM